MVSVCGVTYSDGVGGVGAVPADPQSSSAGQPATAQQQQPDQAVEYPNRPGHGWTVTARLPAGPPLIAQKKKNAK